MGNYHSRPALSAWPRTSQTFFTQPDTAAREREDAAFYESMRSMQQECIDDYDYESDETTATAPKKKRAKKQPILEYILDDSMIMYVMLLP